MTDLNNASIDELINEIRLLRRKNDELKEDYNDLDLVVANEQESRKIAVEALDNKELEIIALKAKLYDFIVKTGQI